MTIKTSITGFPRIGEKRELKKALENFWSKKSSKEELEKVAKEIRKKSWLYQKSAGIDLISCNDFSLYDSMLDTSVMLSAIPERFEKITDSYERYFAMARGCDDSFAMEMTKWFNTNYHFIVPELEDKMEFKLNPEKIFSEYNEAKSFGINPKINIIGPITFLCLSKDFKSGDTFGYFDRILSVYIELVKELEKLDEIVYMQFEEPIFVKDVDTKKLELLSKAYEILTKSSKNVKVIVATYYENSCEANVVLSEIPIWGIALDFVYGKKNLQTLKYLKGKKIIAGIVDGRNIWINDIDKSVSLLNDISQIIPKKDIIVSTSCSLLHVPYTLKNEKKDEITNWLSFGYEKVNEVVLISKIFNGEKLSLSEKEYLVLQRKKIRSRIDNSKKEDNYSKNKKVFFEREESFQKRIALQKDILNLPLLPTTTIGSFPQTEQIRKLRSDFKKGIITDKEYENGIKEYIDYCIAFQEEIGLDILVHGEPERTDMVEYFAEMLNGFYVTKNGWVQSYGSRCVKPPIIYGKISRKEPMTVNWITYAQSKTKKIVKGMLTGPVTILNWSFVRDDIEREDVCKEIALNIRDEIIDLQNAGIKIIQVDEAAFKEGYPLRRNKIKDYERWAISSFKTAVSSAKSATQIHTHMCYSDFSDMIKTLQEMDADVITIENSRSSNSLISVFKKAEYKNHVGPGVYDIHSPRVPSKEEILENIKAIVKVIPVDRVWINPDCGLKTRKWEEVRSSLKNMVEAAKVFRTFS